MDVGDYHPKIGSEAATVKLKEEESLEEAKRLGVGRPSENTSVQLHEDSISQFSSSDRDGIQTTEHMQQAVKKN